MVPQDATKSSTKARGDEKSQKELPTFEELTAQQKAAQDAAAQVAVQLALARQERATLFEEQEKARKERRILAEQLDEQQRQMDREWVLLNKRKAKVRKEQ